MLHSCNDSDFCSVNSAKDSTKFLRKKELRPAKTKMFLSRCSLVLILFSTTLLTVVVAQWESFPRRANTDDLWIPNMPSARMLRGSPAGGPEPIRKQAASESQAQPEPPVKQRSHIGGTSPSKLPTGNEPRMHSRQSRKHPLPPQSPQMRPNNANKVPRSNSGPNNQRMDYALPPQPRNYGQIGPQPQPQPQQSRPTNNYPTPNARQALHSGPPPTQVQSKPGPHGQQPMPRGPPAPKAIPGWSDFPPRRDHAPNRLPHSLNKPHQVIVPLAPHRGMKFPHLPQHQFQKMNQKPQASTPKPATVAAPTMSPTTHSTATTPAPVHGHQHREPRPVSQQPGQLYDSWPNSNVHHHLAPVSVTPTGKPPVVAHTSIDAKIRFSNNSLHLGSSPSSTTKRSVFQAPDVGPTASLSPTQKEKILQMTNTLTKLSPKKPIHVFMRLEGIRATQQGADVGEVIKKYAGSSKVPFFNGTIPMNQIPTVFLAPEDMIPPHGYGKIPIPMKTKANDVSKWRGAGPSAVPPSFSYPAVTPKPTAAPFSITYLPQKPYTTTTTPRPAWSDWGTAQSAIVPTVTLAPPTQRSHVTSPSPSMVPPMSPFDGISRSSPDYPHVQTATSRSSQGFPHTSVSSTPRNPFIAPATASPPPGYTKVLLPPGASGSQLPSDQAQKLAQNPNTKTLNTLSTDQKMKIIGMLRKGQTQVYGTEGVKPTQHQQQEQVQQRQPQQVQQQQQQQLFQQAPQQRQPSRDQQKLASPGGKDVRYTTGYKVIQAPANMNGKDPYDFLKGVLPEGAIVESISPLKGGVDGMDFDSLSSASVSIPNHLKPNNNRVPTPTQQPKQQQHPVQFQQQKQTQQNQIVQQQQQQPGPSQRPFVQQQQQGPSQRPFVQQNQGPSQRPFVQQQPFPHSQSHQQRPGPPGLPQPPPQEAHKVIVNPGIQIQLPKTNNAILDNSELSQIIGAIVKTETTPMSPTGPAPQNVRQPQQQQQPNFNGPQQQWNQHGQPHNWQQQQQQFNNQRPGPQQNQQGFSQQRPQHGSGQQNQPHSFQQQQQGFPQKQHHPNQFQQNIHPPQNQFGPRPNQFQGQPSQQQFHPQQHQQQQQQFLNQNHQFQQQNLQNQNQQQQQVQQQYSQQFPNQNPFPPTPQQFRPPQPPQPPVQNGGPLLGAPQTIVFPQNNGRQPLLQQPQTMVFPQGPFAQEREGIVSGPGQVTGSGPSEQQGPTGPQVPAQQETGASGARLPVLIPAPPPTTTRPPPPPPSARPPPSPTPSSRPPPSPKGEKPVNPFRGPSGKPRNPLKAALSFLGIHSTPKPDLILGKGKPHPSTGPGPSQPPRNQLSEDDDSDSSESSQHDVIVKAPKPSKQKLKLQQELASLISNGGDPTVPEINRLIESLSSIQREKEQKAAGVEEDDEDDSNESLTIYKSQSPSPKQPIPPFPPQQFHQQSPTPFAGPSVQPPYQQFHSSTPPPFAGPSPTHPAFHHGPTPNPNPFITHVGSTGRPTTPMLPYSPSPSPFQFISSTPSYGGPSSRPMLVQPTGTPGTYLVTNQSPAPILLQTNPTGAPKQQPFVTFPSPSSPNPTGPTQQYIVQSPSGPPQIITMGANVSPAALHLAAVQSVIRQNLGLNLGPTGAPFMINPGTGNTATFLNGGTVAGTSPSGGTIILTTNTLPSKTVTEKVPVRSSTEDPKSHSDDSESNSWTESKKSSSGEKKYASKEELLKLLSPSEAPSSKERFSNSGKKEHSSNERQRPDDVPEDSKRNKDQDDTEPEDNDRVIEKIRTEEKIIWDGPTPSKIRTEERTISRPAGNKKHSSEVTQSEDNQKFVGQKPGGDEFDSDFFQSTGFKKDSNDRDRDGAESADLQPAISSPSSPSSFGNLLASKMRFDTLKQKFYPENHFLGGSGPDEQQQPEATFLYNTHGQQMFPQHELVRLPDGRLTFMPTSTLIPISHSTTTTGAPPVESTVDEGLLKPSTTYEPPLYTNPAQDANGRFKIRPGDLSKHEDMTPLFSITPSSFDKAAQDSAGHQEQPQQHQQFGDQFAYLSTGAPETSSVHDTSTPHYSFVSGGSANPNNYPNDNRGEFHSTTQLPYVSSTTPKPRSKSSEEKLMFFPSSTSSSSSVSFSDGVGSDSDAPLTDERLLFFPSSTLAPVGHQDILGLEKGESQTNVDGGEHGHEAAPQWEQFVHTTKRPSSSSSEKKESSKEIRITSTLEPSTTSSPSSTESSTESAPLGTSTTENVSVEDKPITWRPTKPPSTKTTEPEPASYVTSAERVLASNVGANSLHAVMAGLPHQPAHKWQDTAHLTNKDVGAQVLYAVSNGAGGVHHAPPPPPGMVPLYHHNTMYVTPGPLHGIHGSTPYMTVTPSYFKPTEKSYYDHWYGTASLNNRPDDRDKYEHDLDDPSATSPRAVRPRYRSKFRIPPGTSFSGEGDSKKLIPIYVQKGGLNRRHRYRTRPTTTTTTPSPLDELPSSEYDDDGLPVTKEVLYDDLEDAYRNKEPSKSVRPEDIDDSHPAFVPAKRRQKLRIPEKKFRVTDSEDYPNERRPYRRRQRPVQTELTSTTTQKPKAYYEDETSEDSETQEDFKPKVEITEAPRPSSPIPTRRRKINKFASTSDEQDEDDELKPMFQVDYKTRKRVRTTTTTTEPTTTTTTEPTTTTTTTEAPALSELPMKKRRKGMRRRITTTTTTTEAPEYETSEEVSEEGQQQPEGQEVNVSQQQQPKNSKEQTDQFAQSSQTELGTDGPVDQTNTNDVQNPTGQDYGTSGGEMYSENADQQQYQQEMVDLSSLEVQPGQYETAVGGQTMQSQFVNEVQSQQQQPVQQAGSADTQVQPPATIMIHGFQPILTQILPHRPQAIAVQSQPNTVQIQSMDPQQQQQMQQSQFNNRILGGQFSNNNGFQPQYFPNNLVNSMQNQQQQSMDPQTQFMGNQGFYGMGNNMYQQQQQPMMGQFVNNGFQQQGQFYPGMMNQMQQQPFSMQAPQGVQVPQGVQPSLTVPQNATATAAPKHVSQTQVHASPVTSTSSVSVTKVAVSSGNVTPTNVTNSTKEQSKETSPEDRENEQEQEEEQDEEEEPEQEEAKHDEQVATVEKARDSVPRPDHMSPDMFMLSGEGSEEEDEREQKKKFISSEVRDPFRKTSVIAGAGLPNNGAGHISNGLLSKKLAGMSLLGNTNSKLKDNIGSFLIDSKSVVKKTGFVDDDVTVPTTTARSTTTTTKKPTTTKKTFKPLIVKPTKKVFTTTTTRKPTTTTTTMATTTTTTTLAPVAKVNSTLNSTAEDDYDLSDLKQLLKKLSSRFSSDELYDDYFDSSSAEFLRKHSKSTTTTTKKPKKVSKKKTTKSNTKEKKNAKLSTKGTMKPAKAAAKDQKPKTVQATTKKPVKPTTTGAPAKINKFQKPTVTKPLATTTKKPVVIKKFTPRPTTKPLLKPSAKNATISVTTTTTTRKPFRPTIRTMKPVTYVMPQVQSLVKETEPTESAPIPSTTEQPAPSPSPVYTTTMSGTKKPIVVPHKPLWVRRRILKNNGTVISEDNAAASAYNPSVKLAGKTKIRVVRRKRPGVAGNAGQVSPSGAPAGSQLPIENLFESNNLAKRVGVFEAAGPLAAQAELSTTSSTPLPSSQSSTLASSSSGKRKLKLVRTGDTAQWKLTQPNNYPNEPYYNSYNYNPDTSNNEYYYNNPNSYNSQNSYVSSSDPNSASYPFQQQYPLPNIESLALTATASSVVNPVEAASSPSSTTAEPTTTSPPLTGSVTAPKKQIRMESSVAVETTQILS